VLENVKVPANTSTVVYAVNENELAKGVNKMGSVMNIKLMEGNNELSVNNFYFGKPKELNLPKPKILLKAIDKNHIEVTTDKLARFVWLQLPKTINAFSDNYFDLLPGEKKIVVLSGKEEVAEVIKKIKVLSLVDTY
jgi:beta-mannosidase